MSLPDAAPAARPVADSLLDLYDALAAAYGGETWHWMPDAVGGPIDVIAGAVLVQHTTWPNAERALASLRAAGALDPRALATLPLERIAALVRVSGTPSVKARRLRAVAETIERYGGLPRFLSLPHDELRGALLDTHGVGPETADAILLYAAGQPAFVIDAYTRRLFRRLGLGPSREGYGAWQRWFEAALPADSALYQRYHGYIVLHAKALCRARPRCPACPLRPRCAEGGRW